MSGRMDEVVWSGFGLVRVIGFDEEFRGFE